jgi:HEAT repeat protein
LDRSYTVEEDQRTLPLILKIAAEDKEVAVRVSAIKALAPICRNAGEERRALNELKEQLSSSENLVKSAAITSIGHIVRTTKDRAEIRKLAKPLTMLLTSRDTSVKRRALWALTELGENLEEESASIVPLLNDPDEQIKNDAYEALRRAGAAREHAIPLLKTMLLQENLDRQAQIFAKRLIDINTDCKKHQ